MIDLSKLSICRSIYLYTLFSILYSLLYYLSYPILSYPIYLTYLSDLPIYRSTYLPTYLPIYLFIYLSIYLSFHLHCLLLCAIWYSIYLSIFIYFYRSFFLSVFPSFLLSFFLSFFLSLFTSIYLYLYLHLSISISIYIYLSLSLSPSLSLSISIHPSIHPSIYISLSLPLSHLTELYMIYQYICIYTYIIIWKGYHHESSICTYMCVQRRENKLLKQLKQWIPGPSPSPSPAVRLPHEAANLVFYPTPCTKIWKQCLQRALICTFSPMQWSSPATMFEQCSTPLTRYHCCICSTAVRSFSSVAARFYLHVTVKRPAIHWNKGATPAWKQSSPTILNGPSLEICSTLLERFERKYLYHVHVPLHVWPTFFMCRMLLMDWSMRRNSGLCKGSIGTCWGLRWESATTSSEHAKDRCVTVSYTEMVQGSSKNQVSWSPCWDNWVGKNKMSCEAQVHLFASPPAIPRWKLSNTRHRLS